MAETEKIYVLSAAALGPWADTDAAGRKALEGEPQRADLQEALSGLCGLNLRRAGRLSELALVGSQTAVKRLGRAIEPSTQVYFATGTGDVSNTRDLFAQVMSEGGANSSPYAFVSSSSNTTAFYVAKAAGLKSQNMTVCQEEFSFEWALRLASSDLACGTASSAIVGGADEYCPPRSEHIHRLPLGDAQVMGEGSGWLCLSTDKTGAIGEVAGIWDFVFNREDRGTFVKGVSSIIAGADLAGKKIFLLPGFRLDDADIEGITKRIPGMEAVRYTKRCGAFHTASAFAAASVFDVRGDGPCLYFHVNTDMPGRAFIFALASA